MLLVLFLLGRKTPLEGAADLAITAVVVLVTATVLVMVLRLIIKGWNRFARWRVLFDVGISQRLLPARWARGGSGLLLLRHILPSAFFAALVFGRVSGPVFASVLALLTFASCVQFINVASRGGSPAAWLIAAWRRLAPLGKQILIWVVILALAFILSRLLVESKRPEREAKASRPAAVLNVCGRPGDTHQEPCDDALQTVREALQRTEQ